MTTFNKEVINTIKEVLGNVNYEIKVTVNKSGDTVVSYKNKEAEKFATIVIENKELALEVVNMINTEEDVFENAIEVVANEFKEYYVSAVNEYKEAKENFKPVSNKYQTKEGMNKYYGNVITTLEYKLSTSPETFQQVVSERALQSAKATLEDTKSKIEKKLKGSIAKIEDATVGLNGKLNGNFYTEDGNGLYFYTIKAEGDVQKPHYRLLSNKI